MPHPGPEGPTGGLTMGASRLVALALLAPLFAMPSAASPATAATHVTHGAQTAQAHTRDTDAMHTDTRHTDTRHTGSSKLRAPKSVHLLAARFYWGRRPPAYPSTRGLRHDLRQTAHYYARVSRGREHVHVRLTRWVRVRASGDRMCNTQGGSLRTATAALRRAGYHPARFNRLMIFTEQCESAASAAQLPGRVSWIRFRAPGMATLVHELGHNLGLEHAYGVVCRDGTQRVALGEHCLPVEYGDSWDAMGHSRGFFSAPALVRLGWAGHIQHVRHSGTYALADVAHAHSANQALRVRAGRTTYWVEYQSQHSPEVGRTIPGVMIRRQVGHGPVEMIDASPGNPTGIAYPDRDLTNSALPVGSSLTTPHGIRFTTLRTGRHARVEIAFHQRTGVPGAPAMDAVQTGAGYRIHWTSPPDHGQIVLGYRVTSWPSGATTFVRGPAGYRTSLSLPLVKTGSTPPTFTVQAFNQDGWSGAGPAMTPSASGPNVTLTAPSSRSTVSRSFAVTLASAPADRSDQPSVLAWAEIGSVACTTQHGPGPYTLQCHDKHGVLSGSQLLTVHVKDAQGDITDSTIRVDVQAQD
jgi:hypothetical protein